jgi:membrane fusion protein (multidrug efflux system)
MQGIKQVYTVGADKRVHVVNVKLGPEYGSDWVIDGGIAPGTTIITDNLQKLREGAPVSPQEKPTAVPVTASVKQPAGD